MNLVQANSMLYSTAQVIAILNGVRVASINLDDGERRGFDLAIVAVALSFGIEIEHDDDVKNVMRMRRHGV